MDFLTLQQQLNEHHLEIFTLNDIVKITGQKKEVVKSKLTILVKQAKILRLKKGYYTLSRIENKLQLQKIYPGTYISLHAALEYYGTTTQRFNTLDLITKNTLKEQTIGRTSIVFHKVKENMFFGYEKRTINNTEVFIADREKTIIDCTYFSSKVYLTDIRAFIRIQKEKIKREVVEAYLKKINSSTLNKRVGYLLEQEGIELRNLNINNKYEKLSKTLPNKGKKNRKWKLIINEEL